MLRGLLPPLSPEPQKRASAFPGTRRWSPSLPEVGCFECANIVLLMSFGVGSLWRRVRTFRLRLFPSSTARSRGPPSPPGKVCFECANIAFLMSFGGARCGVGCEHCDSVSSPHPPLPWSPHLLANTPAWGRSNLSVLTLAIEAYLQNMIFYIFSYAVSIFRKAKRNYH